MANITISTTKDRRFLSKTKDDRFLWRDYEVVVPKDKFDVWEILKKGINPSTQRKIKVGAGKWRQIASSNQIKVKTRVEVCTCCLEDIEVDRYIECSCGYKCCQECCRQFIMINCLLRDPHCMKCKVEWTFRFLVINFDSKWFKGTKEGQYKHYRRSVLLEREKSKIPETLGFIKRAEEAIKGDNLDDFWSAFKRIRGYGSKDNFKYMCSCPKVGCRGLIDLKYRCVVCKSEVCSKCRTIKEGKKEGKAPKAHQTHKCDPETIKTVEYLKKKTKPCPECAGPIQKINGCDQMWCPGCHTTFSWIYGTIETGRIHNPHAIKFMRENGMSMIKGVPIIGGECGGLPQLAFPAKNVDGIGRTIYSMYVRAREIRGVLTHLRNIRTKYQGEIEVYRTRYIMGVISEKILSLFVLNKERMIKRCKTYTSILDTFQNICIHAFRTLRDQMDSKSKLDPGIYQKTVDTIYKGISFTNQELRSEIRYYGIKTPPTICYYRGIDSKSFF